MHFFSLPSIFCEERKIGEQSADTMHKLDE